MYVGINGLRCPTPHQGAGWATKLAVNQLRGAPLIEHVLEPVRFAERLEVDYLLIAKRWWGSGDKLTMLDINEGFASRLIGSSETILRRMQGFHKLGADLFRLTLHDPLFNREVLPVLRTLS